MAKKRIKPAPPANGGPDLTVLEAVRLLRRAIDEADWPGVRRAYAALSGEPLAEPLAEPAADDEDDGDRLLAETRRLNRLHKGRVRDTREAFEPVLLTCEVCRRQCKVHPALVPVRAAGDDDRVPAYQCNSCQTGRRRR